MQSYAWSLDPIIQQQKKIFVSSPFQRHQINEKKNHGGEKICKKIFLGIFSLLQNYEKIKIKKVFEE